QLSRSRPQRLRNLNADRASSDIFNPEYTRAQVDSIELAIQGLVRHCYIRHHRSRYRRSDTLLCYSRHDGYFLLPPVGQKSVYAHKVVGASSTKPGSDVPHCAHIDAGRHLWPLPAVETAKRFNGENNRDLVKIRRHRVS